MTCEQHCNKSRAGAVWAPFGSAVADADASSQGPACAKRVWRMSIEWELMTAQSGRSLVGALDRIVSSSANYWAAMLTDLVAALGFLALGLNRFSGSWVVAGGVVIAGFLSLGLLEYVVPRWVLHGPPSMARRGHAQHHAEPRALISTPLFVIMIGALAIWGVLGLVLPRGLAALLVFGLYTRYNYFALVHHLQHHRGKDVACIAYLRRLERLHHLH